MYSWRSRLVQTLFDSLSQIVVIKVPIASATALPISDMAPDVLS